MKNIHVLLPAVLTVESFLLKQTFEDDSSQQSLICLPGRAYISPLSIHSIYKYWSYQDLGWPRNIILLNRHMEVTKLN